MTFQAQIARLANATGKVVGLAVGNVPDDITANPKPHRPEILQLFSKSRVERRHDLLTTLQQTVEVIALWDGFVNYGSVFNLVSFQHCDVEMIGEDPRCNQSANAAADDDRPVT
jgi:hypothetical protein